MKFFPLFFQIDSRVNTESNWYRFPHSFIHWPYIGCRITVQEWIFFSTVDGAKNELKLKQRTDELCIMNYICSFRKIALQMYFDLHSKSNRKETPIFYRYLMKWGEETTRGIKWYSLTFIFSYQPSAPQQWCQSARS